MLISAIILGIAGGVHCIGMCGPIALMLPVDRHNGKKKALQLVSYHLGRIFTYTIIGLLFGILGLGFRLFGVQQQLSVTIGVVMIVLALLPGLKMPSGILPAWYFRGIAIAKNRLGAAMKKKSPGTFFAAGFLNGLLPCGMVYMAVLAAMTAEGVWKSGLFMTFFGIGTIPLMTVFVYLGNVLKQKARQKLQKLIPVFIVCMGCLFILRGLGLNIPYISPGPVVNGATYNMQCH
ncbi:sulfite exporter TauE/SafE family protein [Sinomicrobium sp. M5D2P17]